VTPRIAVLASGAGTNLQAILTHLATVGSASAGAVTLVASDRAGAGALALAGRAGIAVAAIPRANDGDSIVALLAAHRVDLVVLAGYLQRVPEVVTRSYRGRMLNVHPALLPAFGGPGMYGMRVHQAVLDAGVKLSGVTVHFVDEEYDHGPIVAQWPVPVLPMDTARVLATRVLRAEHRVYPAAVVAVATGRVTLDAQGKVCGEVGAPLAAPEFRLQTEESKQ
jgi:formyltetrahydrofolate-dependent phosphoribosylglycinamide formyltransferase